MNRNRRPIETSIRKKMSKEIKLAQATYSIKEEPPRTDQMAAMTEVKKYPKKTAKTEKSIIETMKNQMQIKKKKKHSVHHSKRSAPGELLTQDAAPASVHKESTRWDKTLVSQSVVKGKALTHKMNKRKFK